MLTSKKERRYAEGLQKYKKYVKVGKYICTRKICFVEKLNEKNKRIKYQNSVKTGRQN